MKIGTPVTGKMVAALKRLGFDRVYDTNFGADLTIMEEANELLYRIKNNGSLPMITSCSPGWINYAEYYYSDLLDHLSSCKSPHEMEGAIIKSYFAQKNGLDPKDIFVVSIMPCTAKKFEKERKQQAEQLKKSIIEDKNLFGDIELNKSVRQKIFDNISKPVYKDEDSGVYITALQKYQKENPNDFLKNVSTIFTLTDGFKNIDKLVAKKASKEIRKGFRELENTLSNTQRNSDGSLNFVGGTNDEESMFKGYKLDI